MSAENRSSNDDVLISFGEAGSETQATGSKSPIQAATPEANANAAMTNAIVPENEMPRPDGPLSAFDVTWAIHSPGSTPWRTAGRIMGAKVRHNRDKRRQPKVLRRPGNDTIFLQIASIGSTARRRPLWGPKSRHDAFTLQLSMGSRTKAYVSETSTDQCTEPTLLSYRPKLVTAGIGKAAYRGGA